MTTFLATLSKELKQIRSHRRLFFRVLLLPVVIIPFLFSILAKVMLPDAKNYSQTDSAPPKIRVAIAKNGNGAALVDRFDRRRDIHLDTSISPYDFQRLIKMDSLDFGLIINQDFDLAIANDQRGKIEIMHDLTRKDTARFEQFAKTIRQFESDILDDRLAALGIDRALLRPIAMDSKNLNPRTVPIENIAAKILAILLALFTLQGAFAMVANVFEKNRNNIRSEDSSTAVADRMIANRSKYLLAIGGTFLGALLTLMSIYFTLSYHPRLTLFSSLITSADIWKLLPLIFALSGLIVSLCLIVLRFNEYYKHLSLGYWPVSILIMTGLYFGVFSNGTLDWNSALLPIFNFVIAVKAVITGNTNYLLLGGTALVLFLLAIGFYAASRKHSLPD